MNTIFRNITAIVAGAITGGIVNMGIITISSSIIPPPEGVDVTSMESLKASMHLFEPRHFIMPFLAHALGAFVGAFIAYMIAANRKITFALIIGGLFLIGGIMNVFLLPAPAWFIILDLVAAYLPMAWIGGKLAGSFSRSE
ncbi:MAG: hypothetical protein JW731_16075 [Bacteroidales bacterium]|nr:hypothetical protein [Bacteroidales bacterium]